MLAMERKLVDVTHDISNYAKDSRLTGEPDGKRYQWREMIERFKQLGRPLTDENDIDNIITTIFLCLIHFSWEL